MMNNKGFTLVELLATLVLLGVISVISYVSISSVINKNKVDNCKNLIKSIEGAVKEYVSDNRYKFDNSEVKSIKLADLYNGHYLTNEMVNPFNKEKIKTDEVDITINLKSDYTYNSIEIKGYDIFVKKCELD